MGGALVVLVSVNLPAGHSRQSASSSLPDVVAYFPGTQSMQSVTEGLPTTAEYFPPAQSVQSAGSSLLTTVEYLPASQAMQVPAAAEVLYLPALQALQVLLPLSPTVPWYPGSHSHADGDVEPCTPPVPEEPLGQGSHTAPPVDDLYVPASHSQHISARLSIEPVYPGLQTQSVTEVEPFCRVIALGGQFAHRTSEDEVYCPSAHSVQDVPPG